MSLGGSVDAEDSYRKGIECAGSQNGTAVPPKALCVLFKTLRSGTIPVLHKAYLPAHKPHRGLPWADRQVRVLELFACLYSGTSGTHLVMFEVLPGKRILWFECSVLSKPHGVGSWGL